MIQEDPGKCVGLKTLQPTKLVCVMVCSYLGILALFYMACYSDVRILENVRLSRLEMTGSSFEFGLRMLIPFPAKP